MGEGRPAALDVPQEGKGWPLTDLPPLLPQRGWAASTSTVAHHASFHLSFESRGCQWSHGGPGGKDFRFRATWLLLKHLNSTCQRESSQRQATRQRAWPCPNKTLLTIMGWGPDHTCRPRFPDPGLENRKSVGAFQSLRPCCDCVSRSFFFFCLLLSAFLIDLETLIPKMGTLHRWL